MLIFGWRTRSTVEAAGAFDCLFCGSSQPCMHSSRRTWFTLFFVPVIPISTVKETVVCRQCGTEFDLGQVAVRSGGNATIGAQKRAAPSLAIASFVFGLVSLPLIVACFSSFVTSVIAIICGHVAVAMIKRSESGNSGIKRARAGLTLGYIAFILTVALFIHVRNLEPSNALGRNGEKVASAEPDENSPAGRLRFAESEVFSKQDKDAGRGNTSEAKAIAQEFANSIKVASEKAFTGGSKSGIFDFTNGEFLTYCELHAGSCLLLVHVPQYGDYKGESRDVLSKIAWLIAIAETDGVLSKGDSLAVAMRGQLLYGDILVGRYPGDGEELVEPQKEKKESLLAFFPDAPQSTLDPSAIAAVSDVVPPSPDNDQLPVAVDSRPSVQMPAAPPSDLVPAQPTAMQEPRVASLPAKSLQPRTRQSPQRPANEFENRIDVRQVGLIEAKGWTINDMAFFGDGRWLVVGRIDQIVTVYDVASGAAISVSDRLDDLGVINAVARSANGNRVLLGGYGGLTGVMPIDGQGKLGDFEPLFDHGSSVEMVMPSPTYSFLLAGAKKGKLAWQPFDGRSAEPRVLQGFDREVLGGYLPIKGSQAFATDGRELLSFSLGSGEILKTIGLGLRSVNSATFSTDGQSVAVSSSREVVEFETETGSEIRRYPLELTSYHIVFHPTRPWLFVGGRGQVTVWDRTTGDQLAVLDCESIQHIKTTAFTSDGRKIAIVPSSAGQSIRVFEIGE